MRPRYGAHCFNSGRHDRRLGMKRSRRNFCVLLSAGVITIAAAAVITTALTKEDNPENNYVDLNELPDLAAQGTEETPDADYADAGDLGDIVDGGAHGESEQAQSSDSEDDTIQAADGSDGKSGTQSEDGSQTAAQASSSMDKPVTSGTEGAKDNETDDSEQTAQTGRTEQNNQTAQTGRTEQTGQAAQSGQIAQAEQSTDDSVQTANPNVIAESLHFEADDGLTWPVRGNIVLNYSADHVIYHPTLNSYRTNPAILISAEVGTPVLAAADGLVLEVKEDTITGLTVTMEIGDGYTLVYGQLADVTAVPGDSIKAGEAFGTVAAPTKYYTLEGSNLYFQVCTADGTENPMLYLE